MKTITICIGNTDNKLSQLEWALYIAYVDKLLKDTKYVGLSAHFSGGSSPERAWQNYCFVIEVDQSYIELLTRELVEIRKKFRQDSIALVIGTTSFI